jgi:hypothetical protein
METEKRLFGKLLKADYGKGGANDFYWGAFYPKYPKGRTKPESPQLSLWINRTQMEIGFYIGDRGKEDKDRFAKNCRAHHPALMSMLPESFSRQRFLYGQHLNIEASEKARDLWISQHDLGTWLDDPLRHGINVDVLLSKDEVLALNRDELVARIAEVLMTVFPLVLLTISQHPVEDISAYLGKEVPPPVVGPKKPTATEDPTVPRPDLQIYTIDDAMRGIFLDRADFEEMLLLLRTKKNVVLQGPPGVGKTFIAHRLAYALLKVADPKRVTSVQFHQSYSYEDFIEGYRPTDGGFALRKGLFRKFCEMAASDNGHDYVLVIDEINRGNLSKIFGELLMLVEHDKRSPEWAMQLAYSGTEFNVPGNVHLIGLMNTADRSLAMVDYALRRRFTFFALEPQFDSPTFSEFLVHRGAPITLVAAIVSRFGTLNKKISEDTTNLGSGFCIGHSFFCSFGSPMTLDENWYQRVVRTEVAPLLREYWFDKPKAAQDAIDRLLEKL